MKLLHSASQADVDNAAYRREYGMDGKSKELAKQKTKEKFDTTIFIHYQHEQRLHPLKKEIHVIHDELLKNTPAENVRLVVGHRNGIDTKLELTTKRPHPSLLKDEQTRGESRKDICMNDNHVTSYLFRETTSTSKHPSSRTVIQPPLERNRNDFTSRSLQHTHTHSLLSMPFPSERIICCILDERQSISCRTQKTASISLHCAVRLEGLQREMHQIASETFFKDHQPWMFYFLSFLFSHWMISGSHRRLKPTITVSTILSCLFCSCYSFSSSFLDACHLIWSLLTTFDNYESCFWK